MLAQGTSEPTVRVERRVLLVFAALRHPGVLAVLCVFGGLLACGIDLHAIAEPHGLYGLTEYDDAVYLGAALRLAGGVVPYRDFIFVQPPAIAVILAPIGALARAVGTREAMVYARLLTAVVGGMNAFLAAWFVRYRGAVAAATAAIGLAVFPSAYFALHTVLLEPYLVLFVLIGMNLLFSRGELASGARIVVAGIALGVAVSVKLWGVVPLVIIAACCWPRAKQTSARLLIGALIGFLVVCLPFFVLAPHGFIHDVIISQLQREQNGGDQFLTRLWSLLGLRGLSVGLTLRHDQFVAGLFGAVSIVVMTIGGVVPILRRKISRGEVAVLALALATFVTLLVPPEFYPHYAYFFAPFFAMAIAVSCSRILELSSIGTWRTRWWLGATAISVVAVVGASIVVVAAVRDEMHYARLELGHAPQNFAVIACAIPAGSCVLTDAPGLTIEANRFLSSAPNCPTIVDALGSELADSPTMGETENPQLVALWRSWFARTNYVLLSTTNGRVPWTPSLRADFAAQFSRVAVPTVVLYVRTTHPPKQPR